MNRLLERLQVLRKEIEGRLGRFLLLLNFLLQLSDQSQRNMKVNARLQSSGRCGRQIRGQLRALELG
jgi:hypothetical protein